MNQFGTAAFYTLGCKLNFSETSTIARNLEDNGFAKVAFENKADIYVINTCSVTDQADKKCRNIVRKALERPTRQIAKNAGVDGSVIVGKLLEQDNQNYGYNAQTGKFTDLVK